MLATRRPAPRGPVRTHRGAARGALVGVGLLVVTGAGAPAALADDTPAPHAVPPKGDGLVTVPAPVLLNPAPVARAAEAHSLSGNFGLGKASGARFTVAPQGDVPPGLDLSGASLTVTREGSDFRATCTTDASGTCAITVTPGEAVTSGSSLQLPPAVYDVSQAGASPGLAPAPNATWNVNLCSSIGFPGMGFPGMDFPCTSVAPVSVPNTSLFRRHLRATVVDGGAADGTGAGTPVAGATFGLSGPDYPRTPAVPGDDGSYDGGTATSGDTGGLTFDGWFLPGTWTLTPGTVPAGHIAGKPATVVVPSTVPDESLTAVADDLVLQEAVAAVATPSGTTGDPAGDAGPGTTTVTATIGSPPAAPPVSTPSAASAPSAPGATTSPSRAGGGPRPAAHPAGALPQIPVLVPVAPAAGPSAGEPPAAGSASGPTQEGPADVVAAPTDSPKLATASTSFVEVGVIGFGILFVAGVVIGAGFPRRRARSRG